MYIISILYIELNINLPIPYHVSFEHIKQHHKNTTLHLIKTILDGKKKTYNNCQNPVLLSKILDTIEWRLIGTHIEGLKN
jgi:hypothetical protein